MSIARHEGRNKVCCDTCPAAYPNTYADADWSVMISDARTAGWKIRKVRPDSGRDTSDLFGKPPRIAGNPQSDPFTHACPDCARPDDDRGLF